MNGVLEKKLAALPGEPGVYIMKDAEGAVIYVGKAISLKNRVRQYFNAGEKEIKVASMVGHIADFDYIIVGSEKEALMLEANLIKRHRPHYNILLKDDKSFPYVRVNVRNAFPYAEIVRKKAEDGAKYFGPYLSAISTREVLDILHRSFPLRSCKKDIARARARGERPCLNYQIGRCCAPCAGRVTEEEYAAFVQGVELFLSGKYDDLKKSLKREMEERAEKLEYEKCATLRDRIAAIDEMMTRQNAKRTVGGDADVLGVCAQDGDAVLQILMLRGGDVTASRRLPVTYSDEDERAILSSAMLSYYTENPLPPDIYLPVLPAEAEAMEELFSEIAGRRVRLHRPCRGDMVRLVGIAQNNAAEAMNKDLVKKQREYERTVGACRALARELGLPNEIHRMECYDISNTQGTDSVGSMTVFYDGKPVPKEYRKFRIKTVEGANDFASLAEVLTRRFMRAAAGDAKFSALPDLLVIDGGKGQLSAVYEVLSALGLEDMPVIGLAKREEEVYLPGSSEPLILDRDSEELKLLTRIRDEAHRFAITYHRGIRQKRTVLTELEGISGIGEKRRRAILAAFSSYDELKNADEERLKSIAGMDSRSAAAVYAHFHTPGEQTKGE